jgi:hypothetical protein
MKHKSPVWWLLFAGGLGTVLSCLGFYIFPMDQVRPGDPGFWTATFLGLLFWVGVILLAVSLLAGIVGVIRHFWIRGKQKEVPSR